MRSVRRTVRGLALLAIVAVVGSGGGGCIGTVADLGGRSTPLPDAGVGPNLTNPAQQALEQYIHGSSKPVFVYFMKPGCGACRAFNPTVRALTAEYQGLVNFVEVDCARSGGLPRYYRIRATPTCVVFRDGREVKRFVGGRSIEAVQQMLNKEL